MPKKHQNDSHKLPKFKLVINKSKKNNDQLFEETNNLNFDNNGNIKRIIQLNNSYPYGSNGYNLQNPQYSVQNNKKTDNNKYFKNYKYDYNVQVNKPSLTYDNFIYQTELKNMTPQEYRYYQKMQEKYFIYNGNYEVANQKPTILAIQANLNYPMYSGGPTVGETNGQIGYTPQATQSPQNINPGNLIGSNNGNVQVYGNSPAYTGVQPKTLPGQNLIAEMNYTQTKANNANINNPAYFNYGKYFY